MDTIETLREGCDTLLAVQAGMTAILGALMATHPDYDQFQLRLTSHLELMLGGTVGQTLSEQQREQARQFVETLQGLKQARGAIDPLGSQTTRG
jgi:hypothetical protein